MERLRGYSSIFSRRVFSDVIKYDDFSHFKTLFNRYDTNKDFSTYFDYIKYAYRCIAKDYRCEYVYKNEIINKIIIKQYGTKNAIAINEFRVNGSIVDLALFNGKSIAYEIKTKYDNKKRLEQQLEDYIKIFQECYVVVPAESYLEYMNLIPNNVGIIVMTYRGKEIVLEKKKKASPNKAIDVRILMRSLRTVEYKNIISKYYGELPNVPYFEMFDRCETLMAQIPQSKLSGLFLDGIKKRVSNTFLLDSFPLEIRQMCLAMNLNKKQSECLFQKLNNTIIF